MHDYILSWLFFGEIYSFDSVILSLRNLRTGKVQYVINISSVVDLFLPLQVIWSAAVGDHLTGLHAVSLQNQPRGAGVCHQRRQDGPSQELSRTCVSADRKSVERAVPGCQVQSGHRQGILVRLELLCVSILCQAGFLTANASQIPCQERML